MSRFGIIVNVDKCVGCHACAIACKEENQVAPGIFYERVERFENIADNFINWFRVSCMHCDKPACMPVCPAKAIHRGPAGEVLVDQKKCIGCRMCERACPYGAPKFNASGETNYFGGKTPLAIRELEPWQRHAAGRAEHCTLCTHRTSQGRPPACVEACGIGAMTWVDFDAPTPEAEKLIAAAKPMNAAAGTEPKNPLCRTAFGCGSNVSPRLKFFGFEKSAPANRLNLRALNIRWRRSGQALFGVSSS